MSTMDTYTKYLIIRLLHRRACRVLKIDPDGDIATKKLGNLLTEFNVDAKQYELLTEKLVHEDLDLIQLIAERVADIYGVKALYELSDEQLRIRGS